MLLTFSYSFHIFRFYGYKYIYNSHNIIFTSTTAIYSILLFQAQQRADAIRHERIYCAVDRLRSPPGGTAGTPRPDQHKPFHSSSSIGSKRSNTGVRVKRTRGDKKDIITTAADQILRSATAAVDAAGSVSSDQDYRSKI